MSRWVDRLVLDKGADWSCSGPLVPGSSSSPSNPSLPTTPRTMPSSDPSHPEMWSLFLHQGYAKFPHFSWPCQALLPPGSLPSLTLSYTLSNVQYLTDWSSLIIPWCPCPEMQTWDSGRVKVLAYSSSAVPGSGQWQALDEASTLAIQVGVSVSLGREGESRRWREKGPQQHQLQRDSQAQPWGWGGAQSLTPGPGWGWACWGTQAGWPQQGPGVGASLPAQARANRPPGRPEALFALALGQGRPASE